MHKPAWMQSKRKTRGMLIGGVLVTVAACTFAGVATTSAYFSDTHSGTISGTIGNVHENTSGGTGTDNLDVSFNNLRPGEPQTVTANYSNTGTGKQDFWIVFNNATALSTLNNLGTYGEVHVASTGAGAVGDVFDSANLNDHANSCGPFAPSGCWPLLEEYKIASNVAPGSGGSVSFTFNYAGKLKTQPAAGTMVAWNAYPGGNGPGQTTVNAADGTGAGLPYEIVTTQPGQSPS